MQLLYTACLKGFGEEAELFSSDRRKEVLDFADKYRSAFGGNVYVQALELKIPKSWEETTVVEFFKS